MKTLILALACGFAPGSFAYTLADFRFDAASPPETRIDDVEQQCEERLGPWPTPAEYEHVEDVVSAAELYFEDWRQAPSGVQFLTDTGDLNVELNNRLTEILGTVDLPPGAHQRLDRAHVRLFWLLMYQGYTATFDELTALTKELEAQVEHAPRDRPVPLEIAESWYHDIQLLTQQAYLARMRDGCAYEVPLKLHVFLQHIARQIPGAINEG